MTDALPLDPVTIVIRRRVRAGREAEYERWLSGLTGEMAQFPGHLGLGVIRPQGQGREYLMVVRFGDFASAEAWEHSSVRAEWLRQVEPLLDGETTIEKQPGLEFWFTPPESAVLRQPPRWKMALLTLAALYPLNLLLNELLRPIIVPLALPLRLLLLAVLVVALMTYLVMPVVTRAASRWLRPRA